MFHLWFFLSLSLSLFLSCALCLVPAFLQATAALPALGSAEPLGSDFKHSLVKLVCLRGSRFSDNALPAICLWPSSQFQYALQTKTSANLHGLGLDSPGFKERMKILHGSLPQAWISADAGRF